MTTIAAFAGSARKDSWNKKLVAIAAEGARQAGARVMMIDLADYPMPVFNEELEAREGMPENAQVFKNRLVEADGLLIASPEYNSAFSPLLKNALDWASRSSTKDETPLIAFRDKYAAIMAASPGHLGGIRGLVFLRMLLGNIGVTVLPDQQAVPNASKAFAGDGSLVEEETGSKVMNLGGNLARALLR